MAQAIWKLPKHVVYILSIRPALFISTFTHVSLKVIKPIKWPLEDLTIYEVLCLVSAMADIQIDIAIMCLHNKPVKYTHFSYNTTQWKSNKKELSAINTTYIILLSCITWLWHLGTLWGKLSCFNLRLGQIWTNLTISLKAPVKMLWGQALAGLLWQIDPAGNCC